MTRIAVDAMGGDHAPFEIVAVCCMGCCGIRCRIRACWETRSD